MVNSQQILELAGTSRWTRMTHGKLDALERFASTTRTWETASRRKMLDDLRQVPLAPRSAGYVHPEQTAGVQSYRRESGATELTPAELVWLQRLPLEPERVSHGDAVRLAGMAATIDRQTSPSSHQLVQSVWGPVKELHDHQQAAHELEVLRASPPPKLPASVLDALTEALTEENPDWPLAGAQERALELLGQQINERDRYLAAAERALQERITAVENAASERTALVR
ncbi:hypothetical protein SAMN04488570_1378 [Nocardioides scoriae]|uniref:Uncharacterized protein n=2 Tax=Nocardioides scoriae TaxID=642780 RepID=A0A1H1QCG4_9ACTN|nr:hypothetical protein SAMN04488570_1378 [Nocardioides scoriae]